MKVTQLCAASLLAVAAQGSELLEDAAGAQEKRQSQGYYAITGATGGPYPRIELRDLQKAGGEMWNIFLLAMTEFEAMDQDVIDSYYQIATIHGMPWQPWDGVRGSTRGRTAGQMGYCPHNNLLFATWHRPYLALFEQKLQEVATGIADRFPTESKSKYQDAASKLRIPYWDWAKALPTDEPVVPTAMSDETVSVTFPNGTTATIDNPLYDYDFHPLDNNQINGSGCQTFGSGSGATGGLPSVCQNSQFTIRAGQRQSDHAYLNSRLRSILPSQRNLLYNILSQYQTFNEFTSAASCGGLARAGNLESLHNPIHTNNFPGHMSPSAVAAYDPMFWMHHANVDRQFALFQALYPDTYIESCVTDTPTYTIEEGQTLDADSPLTPFHRNKEGDFWTSSSSRHITDMGYTYPELADNPSHEALVASVRAQYGGSSNQPATSSKIKPKSKRAESKPTKYQKYLAEVTLPTYGLDDGAGGASPYNVLLFLGDVPSDSENWQQSKSFIGMTSTLGGNIKTDQKIPATIDLSPGLQRAIDANATSTEKAQEYLKKNLRFTLGLGRGSIPKDKLSGLQVSLISTDVEPAQSDGKFDQWVGGFQDHGKVDG